MNVPAFTVVNLQSVGGGTAVRITWGVFGLPGKTKIDWQIKLTGGNWENPSASGSVDPPAQYVDRTDIWSSYDIIARARYWVGSNVSPWTETNVLYAPH